jgi:hypothetical protein
MTNNTKMANDAALDAALDRFIVPPHRADLTTMIVAAAQLRLAPAAPGPSPRRVRRPAWVRGRNFVIGTAAFCLMSATAAAAGLFGGTKIHIPVISTLVAGAADVVQPKAKPIMASPKRPVDKFVDKADAPKALPVVEVPALPSPATMIPTRDVLLAERAQQIAARMDARLTEIEIKRASRGLPPIAQQRRALVERLKAAKTEDERRTALLAIRNDNERRRLERAKRLGIDPATLTRQNRRSLAQTAEDKEAFRSKRRAERRARMEELRALKDADPAALREKTAEPNPEQMQVTPSQ